MGAVGSDCVIRVIIRSVGLPQFHPMVLAKTREAFDHADFVFELKYYGLAYVDGGRCRLVSRKSHVYKARTRPCANGSAGICAPPTRSSTASWPASTSKGSRSSIPSCAAAAIPCSSRSTCSG